MFCFSVGVKNSPNFKISISSWVSGTFDIVAIIVFFLVQHILTSYQFHFNPVLPNAFLLIYRNVYSSYLHFLFRLL